MIRGGFYTALGTPLDRDGRLNAASFARQVEDQVQYQAAGLLIMGSMGLGVFVRDCDYYKTVQTGVEAAKQACPIFAGVTDTSIGRVCDRIDVIKDLKIDGVVATAPYYYTVSDRELVRFYSELARRSPFPVYLYDLPIAARNKITIRTMMGLKEEKNIKGIKTADMGLAKALLGMVAEQNYREDFRVLYSGLDTFNEAYAQSITCNLDGMFACTGKLAQSMYQALASGDMAMGTAKMKDIIRLRDTFAEEQIFPSFTYAMNLLGYEGIYHPDYYFMPSEAQREKIEACMKNLNLLAC
jgi:4-hydroxy-tetrahydrodipicolinate synthase